MNNVLKPVKCGCGGNPVVTESDQYDSFEMLYTVYCDKCGITTDIYTDRDDAVKLWNLAMSGNETGVRPPRITEWLAQPLTK